MRCGNRDRRRSDCFELKSQCRPFPIQKRVNTELFIDRIKRSFKIKNKGVIGSRNIGPLGRG